MIMSIKKCCDISEYIFAGSLTNHVDKSMSNAFTYHISKCGRYHLKVTQTFPSVVCIADSPYFSFAAKESQIMTA